MSCGRDCDWGRGYGFLVLTGAPGETQRSGFAGERTSDEVSELCRVRQSEGYEVREDEGQASRPTIRRPQFRGAAPAPSP